MYVCINLDTSKYINAHLLLIYKQMCYRENCIWLNLSVSPIPALSYCFIMLLIRPSQHTTLVVCSKCAKL